jgi:parallel beta-helix repeat protein
MKNFFILLFILAMIFCLSADADAGTFYVATTGNNNNPGTALQPWLTLQHAVDTIMPGDTILVESGTYAGCRIERSGQANLPCTLKANTGASVLINAAGAANRHNSNIEVELFDVTLSYWVIDGFEVAGALRYGIDLRDTDRMTVQNCFVHNSAVTGIFLAFCYHPLIQYNQSANNGEHGIYQSNSGDYPIIRGNNLHHNSAAGLHMNGDRNFTPGDGIISFAIVEKNVVYENGATTGGSGINCDGVDDSLIRNNLLYNNHASGISLYATDGSEGSSRNTVSNNTIVMASDGRWCINIGASTEMQPNAIGNIIKNNILYTAHSFRGSISTYSGAVSGFVSDYNVIVNRFSSDDGNTNMSLAQWQALGYDLHSFVATPSALFFNPVGNNYHLKFGSPAVNAGTSLHEVLDDLDGRPRPQAGVYDIGSFELPQGTSTIGLFRPSGNFFFLRNTNSQGPPDVTIGYGAPGDLPIVGDWDGNGTVTIGLYRPSISTFFLRNSNFLGPPDITLSFGDGPGGDLPIAGDWDGNGTWTIGVYRPGTSTFFIRNSNSSGVPDIVVTFGAPGDRPIVGDWDGDGTMTIGLFRPSGNFFFLRNSNTSAPPDVTVSFGAPGDLPIVGDWDGNTTTTIGLFRPAGNLFFLRNSNTVGPPDISVSYGAPADKPIVGNWDGS